MTRPLNIQIILHPKFDKDRRSSAISAPSKMFGKFKFLLIFIFIFHLSNTLSPSNLKGGLVYSEEYEQGPIYLNPQSYTVTRDIDTSSLERFVQFTTSFADLYESQCSTTEKRFEKVSEELKNEQDKANKFQEKRTYFVVLWKLPLYQAEFACKVHDGVMPEIRSVNDREEIRQLAIAWNLTQVAAGIKYHTETGKFRYMSDHKDVMLENPFPWMEYGGSYGAVYHRGPFHNDPIIRGMATEYMVVYNAPQATFVIRMADGHQQNNQPTQFLCQHRKLDFYRPKVDESKMHEARMLTFVSHNCRRDKSALIAAARAAAKQAAEVANFEINPTPIEHEELSKYLPKFDSLIDDNKRRKRSILKEKISFSKRQKKKIINNIVDRIDDNEIKLIKKDEDEHIQLARLYFEEISPEETFAKWISKLLNSIGNSDIEKASEEPSLTFTSSDLTVIKCLKNEECRRKRLIKSSSYTKRQLLRQVKKLLTFYLSQHLLHFKNFNLKISDSHPRQKRALPLLPLLGTIVATTIGANVGTSIVNGGAPLSWFGKPLGKLFGFANADEIRALNDKVDLHASAIEALHISDLQTRKTVNEIIEVQSQFEKRVHTAFKAVTAVMLEADLRSFIQYQINLLETNSNKIVLIGLSASTGKASTLALTQNELNQIVERVHKEKGIKLTNDFDSIKMSMIKIGTTLKLIFDIPIIAEDNLYHFYKVEAIPLFENNTMFMPELDAPFLGISKTGSYYVTLTSEEFTRCTTEPSLCTTSSPANPMTSRAHCTVTTYITGNMTCELVESNKPAVRFIHIKGNHTIFSVPEPTLVYIKCNDESRKPQQATFEMQNMGQITFRPGCTINFPDGAKFQTPEIYLTEKLDDARIFQVLDTYVIPKNARIRRFLDYSHRQITPLETSYDFPTLAQLSKDIFHPTRAIGFTVQFIMAASVILFIVITCLCYWKPIRICLGNNRLMCCFDKVDPVNVPDPLRTERIRGILKTGMSKAKSTSDLVLENLHNRAHLLRRSNSAATVADTIKMKRMGYQSDREENEELITLPRDRVKMIYQRKAGEDNNHIRRVSFPNENEDLM